jgi:O-antigen/teichoic acid export membrane protein
MILKNTFFLYVRLLFTIIVSLYTSRVVLQVLGVADFGLYNIVGGVIVMLGFLNAGMIQASQRFLSFEIGHKNLIQLNEIFTTILTIHFMLSILLLFLSEFIGLWFLNNKMNIEPDRINAANFVFQFSIITFMVNIITVPYSAMIISYERMNIFAYISVLEVLLKLLIVYIVQWIRQDKLIVYSILQLLVSIVIFFIYLAYCRRQYSVCRFKLRYNKESFSKVLKFASWSFLGNVGFVFRNQGVNILINFFFNTTINASRAIAYQVSSQVSGFVNNFQLAIVPQITKRYASGHIDSMLDIVYKGSKYSFLLLYIIALPLFFKSSYVLNLWLGIVPQYSVDFLRLILVVSLIDCTAIPLGKAIDATGNIKIFQIVIACVLFLDIPLSYILLKIGGYAYSVMYISIFTSSIGFCVRLFLFKKNIPQAKIKKYLSNVLIRCLIFVSISFLLAYYIEDYFPETFIGTFMFCLVTLAINILLFGKIGMQKEERILFMNRIVSLLNLKK